MKGKSCRVFGSFQNRRNVTHFITSREDKLEERRKTVNFRRISSLQTIWWRRLLSEFEECNLVGTLLCRKQKKEEKKERN